MNQISYQNAIGTIIFDETNRMPLGIVDDLVINPDTFKIESLIIKNSFFKRSQIINSSSVPSWGKNIYVSSYSIKEIESNIITKNILEKQIGIVWNKVIDETGKNIGTVTDVFFNKTNFEGISILVKPSFLGMFYFGKGREIMKKDIVDVTIDGIVVKNLKLVKA